MKMLLVALFCCSIGDVGVVGGDGVVDDVVGVVGGDAFDIVVIVIVAVDIVVDDAVDGFVVVAGVGSVIAVVCCVVVADADRKIVV